MSLYILYISCYEVAPLGGQHHLQRGPSPSPRLGPGNSEARGALEKGEESSAFLLSDKLLLQLEADANRIDAAFVRFDYSGSGALDESEVAAMRLGRGHL